MRSLAFFPRQWRDHLVTRGTAMVFVAVFIGLEGLVRESDPAFLLPSLSAAVSGMTPFLVLIATYGIIGTDTRLGHFRLLFSKPISPVWYYAQALVGAWLTFSAVLLLFIGVFALAQAPTWPTDTLLSANITFLLLGAMVFGVSRYTRLDWLIAMMLMIFGTVLRAEYPAADSLYGKVYNVALPPSHLDVSDIFVAMGGTELGPALWILSYAGLFVVAGLASVRFVPMGTAR